MRHLICLTIDTDPDGLAGREYDRETLTWRGLEQVPALLDALATSSVGRVPITWFIRADGQLQDQFGSALFLLEKFDPFWRNVRATDELGWHPHLYRKSRANGSYELITEPAAAAAELENLWRSLAAGGFRPVSFRNGEGWHHTTIFQAVEQLGLLWDSTAIPGRVGGAGHPMDWQGAPNHPYFPSPQDVRRPGAPRPLLEVPMTSWYLKAPYDAEPRLRYINPAVHEELFSRALQSASAASADVNVWTLILHPDEVLAGVAPDDLYPRSPQVVCRNLARLAEFLGASGHAVEFTTIAAAGQLWRNGSPA